MVLDEMARRIATKVLGINHSKNSFFFLFFFFDYLSQTFAILGLNATDVSSFSKMSFDAKCTQKLSDAPQNDLTNRD